MDLESYQAIRIEMVAILMTTGLAEPKPLPKLSGRGPCLADCLVARN